MQSPQTPVQQPPNNIGPAEQEPTAQDNARPMNVMNWVLAAIALVLFVAVIFFGSQQASQPKFVPAPKHTASTTAVPILGGGSGASGSTATTTSSGGTSGGGVVPAAGSNTNGTATGSNSNSTGSSSTNGSTTGSSSSSGTSGAPTSQPVTGPTPGAAGTP